MIENPLKNGKDDFINNRFPSEKFISQNILEPSTEQEIENLQVSQNDKISTNL